MNNQTISFFIALAGFFAGEKQTLAQAQPASAYPIAAKDAAWCWFSDPRVVYHKGSQESIYFGYINSKGDAVISSRNQRTKQLQSYTLHERLEVDDHDVPAILFLPDGHILAFYTEHGGRFFMRKSKNPEDISSWEEERIIPFGGNSITYAHPVMLKEEHNRIYMFWRGSDWKPSFAFSDDLGDTWSPGKPLISNKNSHNRPYLKVCSDNKSRIDFTFTDGHPNAEPNNSVYHMYYEKGLFHQTNGDTLASMDQLPLQPLQVNKVYDASSSKAKAWIADIALDANNRPVIVYTRFPQDNDHRYHYAQWNGKQWADEELCKAGGWVTVLAPNEKVREPNYSGGICLDHHNPSNVYLARPVNGIFEIEHWKKKISSWKREAITSQSAIASMRPCVAAGYRGKRPIVLWMTGLYRHYTQFNTDLRINYPSNARP